MKKQVVIAAVFFIAALFSATTQSSAQNTDHKSNGVLEIISLHLPDSVVFKPADGQVLKDIVEVYFISGRKQHGARIEARNISIDDDLMPFFTEHAVFRVIPSSGIDAQKIRFVVNHDTVYHYDLLRDEWEPESTAPNAQST